MKIEQLPTSASMTPAELVDRLEAMVAKTDAQAILFWDTRLGSPDDMLLQRLVDGRGDVWHGGLVLGAQGQPGMIDFVAPSWMHNCDPAIDREGTSWRVVAAACLVRTEVFRQLGLPRREFQTVAGAMLEWGHRAIMRGAFMRHVPRLVPAEALDRYNWAAEHTPTLDDEARFIAYRYGRFWTRWASMRAAMTKYAQPRALLRAWQQVPTKRPYDEPPPYQHTRRLGSPDLATARVTVLIPTLNRYPYLHVVLENLRAQTVRPHEIIVIDQTKQENRDPSIAQKFADLPLRLMFQDVAGQCSSRNAGLAVSSGDFVLFIDDDDELPPTLIEEHLRNLYRFDADVSSGVLHEVGTEQLGASAKFVRASDVFPTSNTLVRREVLRRSGLFDLAFNRAPRADGELGMRVHQSGAFMVLDQSISVEHHRAPEGGLRVHGARVITYRSSRESLTQRHLPHISEIYLVARHFSPRQRREVLWMRAFETLSARGSATRRLAKMVVGGMLFPDTVKQTLARERAADEWLQTYPQIAELDE